MRRRSSSVARKNIANSQAISLFSGAGGLDLGLEKAGFAVNLCIEIDQYCQGTLKHSRPHWCLAEPGDIQELPPEAALEQAGLDRGELALLVGGPPCQPFSKAAYWVRGETARMKDPRAGVLDAYLSYVQYALPEVLILENVRGLTYTGKDEGLQLLRAGLQRINRQEETNYSPVVLHLNAAGYGVPQLRERTFVVAHRLGANLQAPSPTHADLSRSSESAGESVVRYATAWDAIGDLADCAAAEDGLEPTGKWAGLLPSIPEGENYLWHTGRKGGQPLFGWRTRYWSFLLKLAKDRPSWTISAQPGPATGPFHWNNRRLSVRELARLQTFPDEYEFAGSYREVQRQIGNAVPPALGELLGLAIREQLFDDGSAKRPLTLIPALRDDCPPAEPLRAVPRRYLRLRGKYSDHPGIGQGPSARKRVDAARIQTESGS